ncbi:helix-turn-helix domain-containing protein [Arsenicibacter rosenii]|uniref:HTH cro/C1-type domain-containing protein n=1 Tax=Arsenicibacter rosenii TaxID=1750698 RepID=A0A1S2VJS6_9BACT|nr:helix-turn-helix transcriptional regulator [Arsenicibacter rosenii]OIN58640.1 hypothetical protein BLX24_13820 [Arsenicibacter rosenii]
MNINNELPPVASVLYGYEQKTGLKVKRDRSFYARIEINPKRFGLLLRGKIEPTISEADRIAKVFGVTINEILTPKQ